MATAVKVDRVNANEDQVQIIEIHVADGQAVTTGDLLFVLETTKAAIEVMAPCDGQIRGNALRVGDFVDVGALLCVIAGVEACAVFGTRAGDETGISRGEPFGHGTLPGTGEILVTAKARKIAQANALSLDGVRPVGGRIGEAQVLDALALRAKIDQALHKSPAAPKTSGRLRGAATLRTRRSVIIGGGGHAACLIDALEQSGYDIVGCTDQALPQRHAVYRGVRIVGTEADLAAYRSDGVHYAFIGVGGADSSLTRRKLFERALDLGYELPPVIHPRAIVSAGATIGAGCHILAGCSIGPRCRIGENVIVNQGSIVCHDSAVADHVHITPGATLAGGVSVGAMSVIGMGASVLYQVKIGENCLIHNGAQVNSDVDNDTIVDSKGRRSLR